MPELVILGSGGWIPQDDRATTSLALRFPETLFVFDAGTGLARLGAGPYGRLLPPGDRPIHIFLSHLHLDHTVGLTFLPGLWSNPTVVHFPAHVAGVPGPEIFDRLFGGPFFPVPFRDIVPGIAAKALTPGETWVEGHRVLTRMQRHPGGSMGYRVDDTLAFVTDTSADPGTVDLARGVRVLVHETASSQCGASDGEPANLNGHSTPEDAARIARDAGARELLLCHLLAADVDCYADMLARARAIFPQSALGADGMTRDIP